MAAIRLYQRAASPGMPPACRFQPTCSYYSYEAIDRHGLWKGGWLTVRRLARCQPFNSGGYDPVPEAQPAADVSRETPTARPSPETE